MFWPTLLLLARFIVACTVVDERNVTYQGFVRNGIDVFLNIPYAQDTGGENRFAPPRPYVPASGITINATYYGPACPQQLYAISAPITGLTNVTEYSEDCLNLNVARPPNTPAGAGLPVMVFIHGGSFWQGFNGEIEYAPDGLILQSIENRLPVIHVVMNYRLGAFGFAQNAYLKDQKSENAGLRDQRLAIEWVRDNIEAFGGDPERITIFGQSSGGLAIGMQTLAYGGAKPLPFQQGICESQALEPGITANFTFHQMDLLSQALNCSGNDLNSAAVIDCLRSSDTETFLQASLDTYSADISNNIGDCWLPAVDGDFLPDAPSTLLKQGRFGNSTQMIGWCEDDVNYFTEQDIYTDQDVFNFVAAYLPAMSNQSVADLLALYPITDFFNNTSANLTAQFYRAARIFRDVLMTCQPIYYGQQLNKYGNIIYYYDQNSTILDVILASQGDPGQGVVHTSEFAYVFGNLSHYNTNGYPYNPTAEDYRLQTQESRTWSTFAAVGQPSLYARDTLQGFDPAYVVQNNTQLFVIGGPDEGLSTFDGPDAKPAIVIQKLRERCGFINSPAIIAQLAY